MGSRRRRRRVGIRRGTGRRSLLSNSSRGMEEVGEGMAGRRRSRMVMHRMVVVGVRVRTVGEGIRGRMVVEGIRITEDISSRVVVVGTMAMGMETAVGTAMAMGMGEGVVGGGTELRAAMYE